MIWNFHHGPTKSFLTPWKNYRDSHFSCQRSLMKCEDWKLVNWIEDLVKFYSSWDWNSVLTNLLSVKGPFLGRVLNDVRKKIDGNFNQTLHLYSGHDSTIANVLSALGQYNFQCPPYSSSLLFELREKDDDHYITVRTNSMF